MSKVLAFLLGPKGMALLVLIDAPERYLEPPILELQVRHGGQVVLDVVLVR